MAGHVVRHLPEPLLEVGFEQARFLAQHEILERIEHRVTHRDGVGIVRVDERQLLLEHEGAGRHRCEDRVAFRRVAREDRDIDALQRVEPLEIAELELGHAAARLVVDDDVRDFVVPEDRGEVVAHRGFVVVDVAGGENRHLARRIGHVFHRESR